MWAQLASPRLSYAPLYWLEVQSQKEHNMLLKKISFLGRYKTTLSKSNNQQSHDLESTNAKLLWDIVCEKSYRLRYGLSFKNPITTSLEFCSWKKGFQLSKTTTETQVQGIFVVSFKFNPAEKTLPLGDPAHISL